MQDTFADAYELLCGTIEIRKTIRGKGDPLIMPVKHLVIGPTDQSPDGNDASVFGKVMFKFIGNRQEPVVMVDCHCTGGGAGDFNTALENKPCGDGDELRADMVKFLR